MTSNVIPASITHLIGNTPLLRIRMFESEFPQVEVYAKASGSIRAGR